jgi:uncharacterized protein YaiE (UPF0345 family)
MQRRRLAAIATLPMAGFLLLAFPAVAAASIGVGIQVGPVRLAGIAHAGQTYDLPPVYVVNTGTQDETVRLDVKRLSKGDGFDVPKSWFQPTRTDVHLDANQSTTIDVKLVVPADARPGRYFSDVVAHGSASIEAGQATLGVAAATKLQFTVGKAVPAGFWSSLPTIPLAVAAAVILLGGGAFLVARRSGFRIRVERTAAYFPDDDDGDYGLADSGGGPS